MPVRCRDANWPTYVTSPAARSFRVALRETAILATRIKQVAYRCGLHTSCAVEASNLKGDQLPRGCIAQAWSVAEILRAYVEDVKNISPEPTIESQPTQASAQLKDRSAARAVREVSMTRTGA